MINLDDYRLSKNVSTKLLNRNGFQYGTFKCFIYKDIIQLIIHIDIENRIWEYQVYDVDHGSLYISYYNSDVVKTIDKKIRKIMKEFENQKIIVKEREDANE